MKRLFLFGIAMVVFCLSQQAYGFEYVDQKKSYVNLRYLTLRVGIGTNTFTNNDYVNGTPGPAFQFSVLHPITNGIDIEFMYQFSTFRFDSPDPIINNETINTRTGMHQELLRFIFYIPSTMGQPFVSAGIGGYHFTGLDSKTALDLPFDFEVPVGVGFRGYIMKDRISVQFEYVYHFLFGANQSESTLELMGIPEFKINAYTLMGSFSFHFF